MVATFWARSSSCLLKGESEGRSHSRIVGGVYGRRVAEPCPHLSQEEGVGVVGVGVEGEANPSSDGGFLLGLPDAFWLHDWRRAKTDISARGWCMPLWGERWWTYELERSGTRRAGHQQQGLASSSTS